MRKATNLTGQRFGRLVVIERAPDKIDQFGYKKVMWRCLCDCGNEKIVNSYCLQHGETKSCGCLHKESIAEIQGKYHYKHGGTNERLYNVWQNMRKRCSNKLDKNYGGRGISICKEWEDYNNFRKWALENGYSPESSIFDLTLDRINVNGNYEPSNCRWVNLKIQNNNRRNNKLITYNGETKTLAQWAERLGINYFTLRYRISHWPIERAMKQSEEISAS